MSEWPVPARHRGAAPVSGVSRDGQPLSASRAPAPDLAPWISRVFVTTVRVPEGQTIACGILNDTAFVRLMFAGKWSAFTADGPVRYEREALFFGPQSKLLPVSVEGSFSMVGFGLRPGACHALKGPRIAAFVDRVVPFETVGAPPGLLELLAREALGSDELLLLLEDRLRGMIRQSGGAEPDLISARFDRAAFADPGFAVSDFARDAGIDQRRLERLVRRDFGISPKQVLRRARVLDMASHLRGVADDAEAETLALRYYDQSHLIREFQHFLGQTPAQFVARPQPILTLALEVRQARRLEELGRLVPGARRPWLPDEVSRKAS